MKIVLLSTGSPTVDTYPPQGGIQYQIYHTAQELKRLGHEPVIVTREQEDQLPPEVTFHSLSAPLSDEIFSRILFSYRAAKAIRDIDPDVVLAYERFSAVFPARSDYPFLFFTSNYDAMEFYRRFALDRHWLNRIAFPVKKRIEEQVMRLADRVMALNPGIQSYLESRDISHTNVVPNGVDITSYRNGGDGGFVFYAGRLNEVKGVRFLIEAFAQLKNQEPNLNLKITGDGEQREFLERRVRGLNLTDRVEFTGWIDRSTLHDNFSRCSVFVLPSLFETFGIVVLEAMASEKPVVASDIRGPGDIITAGENGLLVKPQDTDALATAIASLVADDEKRTRLGRAARQTIETQYSFPVIAERILDISEDIVSDDFD